jgi:hypothetical protein
MDLISKLPELKFEVPIDKDYDGFELESYVDMENIEFLSNKKNSFTQKIENITEFCLS